MTERGTELPFPITENFADVEFLIGGNRPRVCENACTASQPVSARLRVSKGGLFSLMLRPSMALPEKVLSGIK